MNQQRSRRYRVPRELAQAATREEALNAARRRRDWESEATAAAPGPPPFDSNCITPGTEFLYNLGDRYREWIAHKMATDPDWMDGPQVIFSGADVPGEGEHKIMDYIRDSRLSGAFAEDTRHCMYGLDADLIMLGMVTHEQHFTLLRERQRFQRGKFAPRQARRRGGAKAAGGDEAAGVSRADDDDFVFLELELLRELLAGTMRPSMSSEALAFEWETERAVDDFVFMCMLVGNDFIPGMPHLSVEDGALNKMLRTPRRHVERARVSLHAYLRYSAPWSCAAERVPLVGPTQVHRPSAVARWLPYGQGDATLWPLRAFRAAARADRDRLLRDEGRRGCASSQHRSGAPDQS